MLLLGLTRGLSVGLSPGPLLTLVITTPDPHTIPNLSPQLLHTGLLY